VQGPPLVELPGRETSLFSHLRSYGQWSTEDPAKPAITDLGSGETIAWSQLAARVQGTAHALTRMGLVEGDVVNIHLHNSTQFVLAFLAIGELGGVATTSSPMYTKAELQNQYEDSGTRFILSSRLYQEAVLPAAEAAGIEPSRVSFIEDPSCFANAPADDTPLPPLPGRHENSLLVLPYSSGTTGKPKGVQLSHRNVIANVLQCVSDPSHHIGILPTDTTLGILPLYHIYGMTVLMGVCLAKRCHLVLMAKFEPKAYLEALQSYRVTAAFVAPPVALFLAQHPMVDEHDLSSLRYIFSGAAPLSADTQQALNDQLAPTTVVQGWGMTELSPIGLYDAGVGDASPVAREMGSCGTPAPGTSVKVIDPETGSSLGEGETGELYVHGPQVMQGYLDRPEATAETIVEGGYLRTGDVGYVCRGHVFVVDRFKELIKVKGMQVPPAEVEAALLTLPGVIDAAVVGVADERSGEVPKAFVVRAPGSDLSAERVKAGLATTLAAYKIPRDVVFIETVPKSPSGKILRRELR